MNKNITEEELLLRKRARRRLLGATVLVIASIIILPMIFDEPKPDTETHEIDIHLFPEEDITEIPPLVLPSEDFPQNNDIDQVIDQSELSTDFSHILQSLDQMSESEEQDESTKKNQTPIPGIKPRLEVVQAETIKQPNQTTEEFVVQLGAFSDQSKAQQQLNSLISNGINAYTETHILNGNVMTRVRIGPFLNRMAAENELEKLKKQGLDGVVTPK